MNFKIKKSKYIFKIYLKKIKIKKIKIKTSMSFRYENLFNKN